MQLRLNNINIVNINTATIATSAQERLLFLFHSSSALRRKLIVGDYPGICAIIKIIIIIIIFLVITFMRIRLKIRKILTSWENGPWKEG